MEKSNFTKDLDKLRKLSSLSLLESLEKDVNEMQMLETNTRVKAALGDVISLIKQYKEQLK